MNRLVGCVLGAFFVLGAGLANAAVMDQMSLAELSTEAEVVAHGMVVSSASRFEDAPHAARIVTDVTVRLIDKVRGIGPDEADIVVTTLGGEMGERGQWVPGAPRFAVGDEVVLFLTGPLMSSVGARYVPVGLSQGVFFVDRVTDANRILVRQRMAGVAFRTAMGTIDDAPAGLVTGLQDMLNGARKGCPSTSQDR